MNRIQPGVLRWLIPGVAVVLLLAVAVTMMPQSQANESDDSGDAGSGSTAMTSPIHIDMVEVRIAESYPPQVFAHVVGTIPDSCTTVLEPDVREEGTTITVEILGERPSDAVCAQVISEYEKNISLGSFEPGDYTLIVNGQKTPFHVN